MPRRTKKKSSKPTWLRAVRTGASVATTAYKAYKGVQAIRKLVNVEVRKLDIPDTSTYNPDNSTGSVFHLSALAEGDSDNARTGNSIMGKYLTVRYTCIKHASASATNVRMLIVRDNQQIADSSPTIAQLLDTNGSDYCLAPLNDDTVGRFQVLHDVSYQLDANRLFKTSKINLPIKFHIRFNGNADTDIQRNGIYLLVVTSEATNTPTFKFYSRLGFHDN